VAATFANEGLLVACQQLLSVAPGFYPYLVPVEDNLPFQATDVWTTHTQTTIPGGGQVSLAPANWTFSVGGGDCQATYPTVTFNFGAYAGGKTIYGWMVGLSNGTVERLYFGDQLATPFAVPSAGGSLQIVPVYHHKQC